MSSGSGSGIQVPASPIKKARERQDDGSHFLGGRDDDFGRGSRAANPFSFRGTTDLLSSRSNGNRFSQRGSSATRQPVDQQPAVKGPSFSERLTSTRIEEAGSCERRRRVTESRSKAFGLGRGDMDEYKAKAVEIPDIQQQPITFDRDAVLSKEWRNKPHLHRSNTAPSPRKMTGTAEASSSQQHTQAKDGSADESRESFEPFSSFHLSRRYLPHRIIARHLSGKKLVSIKGLLRDVKAPNFELPDVEQDLVVLAIIANKSAPRSHNAVLRPGQKEEDRGKYMVLSLCDLEYSVDLFLFNSGFDRFWKLTEGTVVAILNPGVLPPPPGRQDTGRFSLVINSDEDTIIELGAARDLGSCQSIRKDGNACGSWVNRKRTSFCEFHTNEAVQRTRSSRIELNTDGGFGHGPRRRQHNGEAKKDGGFKDSGFKDGGFRAKGPKNYDWETKTRYFTAKTMSAADLIDGKGQSAEDKKEREAHIKRSMEIKEREREIMKKLALHGDASGQEYMRLAAARDGHEGPVAASSRSGAFGGSSFRDSTALASLGLDRKNRDIQLHMGKRKRANSSQNDSAEPRSSSILGWGGGLRDKLSRMKAGEKLRRENQAPPVQKKTRFITEQGIREAGRESMESVLSSRQVELDDDDDDELLILQ
ncbi:minichromosome maintenance protein 10 [Geosmithia morbida]|uniref:Minichromosome maintenance protein 10 n=1 Tax=Geosmithia morbida TaxID=1094350 RepID=A0A9P4YZ76_9HYPO|nr:minichromosome maintenance protein 10 [Geosmithia morbida]KAF4124363.1 minichromosome maintenance protein 10 [Geosmithia morbida]